MADSTFQELWRQLRLYHPELPIPLAQQFINTAYSRALARRAWSGLRAESAFVLPAPVTGTASVTQNSASVDIGASGAPYIGRQFFVGGRGPYYTIIDSGATTIILDRTYSEATNPTAGYTIQLTYLTAPSDMRNLISVRDMDNNWKLHINAWTQEELDRWDAKRSSSGTPWLLVAATPVPSGGTISGSGTPRYELWPRAGAAKTYQFVYIKRPPLMSAAADVPILPFRGDVLRTGALAELSLWPGTAQVPNPYFSADTHTTLKQEFEKALDAVTVEDEELAQTTVRYLDDYPFAPLDAAFIQAHGGVF